MTVIQVASNRWDLQLDDHLCTVFGPTSRNQKWVAAYRATSPTVPAPRNGYLQANTRNEAVQLFAPFRGARAQFKRAIP